MERESNGRSRSASSLRRWPTKIIYTNTKAIHPTLRAASSDIITARTPRHRRRRASPSSLRVQLNYIAYTALSIAAFRVLKDQGKWTGLVSVPSYKRAARRAF